MQQAIAGAPLADPLIVAARFPSDIPRLIPYVAIVITTAQRLFSSLIPTNPQLFGVALDTVR